MKRYIFPLFIASVLVLTHFASTDMKALTDKELNSVTGQAGIEGFESVFTPTSKNTAVTRSGKDVRKKVFDEVFVKKSETDTPHPNTLSFDEAFVNTLALDFTKTTEQKLKMTIQMEQISFNQAFSTGGVPNINFDKSYLNEKMNNAVPGSRKGIKIKFN